MFQEPHDEVVVTAAAKLDRAAAQQRSAIRGQATVRPGRQRDARERIRDRERSRDIEQRAELHIAQLETELARWRDIRRQRSRLDHNIHNSRDVADLLRQTRETINEDDDTVTTRVSSPRAHLPRPTRESNLRFEVEQSGSVSPRRIRLPSELGRSVSPQRSRLLSPPSSSEGNRNVPDGLVLDDTPRPTRVRQSIWSSDEDLPTPPPETWEASYPPLRRVGHLSPRPTPRVDGLGDRRRSPTPDNQEEEETWVNNLLTTMEDQNSSTATSFASDSVTRPRSSQNTSTSFGEIGQLEDGCDLDLAPGITEEDARAIREQHRRERRSEPDGPIMTGQEGLRQHQERQRRARRVDLGIFQELLERLGRGEEIPDEWRAAIGLDLDGARGT